MATVKSAAKPRKAGGATKAAASAKSTKISKSKVAAAMPEDTSTAQLASKKKKDTIHPNYRALKVIMTDGTEFMTKSTYHAETLKLDIDTLTHPAWTKEINFINQRAGEVARFNEKFGSIKFSGKKSEKV
ncbi:large subunit ribosomal protein L31 [Alphaproteobacteria bacterium]